MTRGFTFLGLLFLIALMTLMAAAAATTWSFDGQREKERQLLFAGRAYRVAIARYARAHAREAQPYPTDLVELLGDSQKLVPVRYLRRLYADPMTADGQWGLVRTAQGGITGLYSLSPQVPIRTRGTAIDEGIDFAGAKSYRDWVFTAQGLMSGDDGASSVQGEIPGWNYARDGEPPLQWKNGPPTAADRP